MHGPPVTYDSVWNSGTPPDGPAAVDGTFGFIFTLDAPGKLAGFRWYTPAGKGAIGLCELIDWTTGQFVAVVTFKPVVINLVLPAPAWRTVWYYPRPTLAAGTEYKLGITMWGGAVYRHDNILFSGDYVSGHVTVPRFASDSNSGGRFSIPENVSDGPQSSTTNLYGVDVLIRVT